MPTLPIDNATANRIPNPLFFPAHPANDLASSGRRPELGVSLAAMTPGEIKAGGAGLTINYGIHPTRFGPCLIAKTDRGLCNLHFLASTDPQAATQGLRAEWPQAQLQWQPEVIQGIGDRLWPQAPTADLPANPLPIERAYQSAAPGPMPLRVKGTPFQLQVWQALLAIPPGGLTTYQGLAAAIGRPTAARAVGNAVGRNPIAYLIPCHRVIRASGELGGFRWGLARKAALLEWEAQMVTGPSVGENL